MKIEKITVSGLNSALAAIGLSYGDEYDPFKVSTKKLANTLVSRGVSKFSCRSACWYDNHCKYKVVATGAALSLV